jgi:hypothetical protein
VGTWHIGAGGRGEAHTGFWLGNLRERHHLEDLKGDGKIIWNCTFINIWGGGGVDWIALAQDRDTWWGLVRRVMNLPVP